MQHTCAGRRTTGRTRGSDTRTGRAGDGARRGMRARRSRRSDRCRTRRAPPPGSRRRRGSGRRPRASPGSRPSLGGRAAGSAGRGWSRSRACTEARTAAAKVRGHALQLAGRMDEVREHFEAALTVHRESWSDLSRNRGTEGIVLGTLGNLHRGQGGMNAAREDYDAALAVAREVGNRRAEGGVLGNLDDLYCVAVSGTAAREMPAEALATSRQFVSTLSQPYWLNGLALRPSPSAGAGPRRPARGPGAPYRDQRCRRRAGRQAPQGRWPRRAHGRTDQEPGERRMHQVERPEGLR